MLDSQSLTRSFSFIRSLDNEFTVFFLFLFDINSNDMFVSNWFSTFCVISDQPVRLLLCTSADGH